jgi:hypothetical protein
VAYQVEIDETVVLAYLSHPDRGLTPHDLDKLLRFLEDLATTGEQFRADETRRCSPGSSHFEVTYIMQDSTHRLRCFRFIVSDAAAVYGILRVRFAEEM